MQRLFVGLLGVLFAFWASKALAQVVVPQERIYLLQRPRVPKTLLEKNSETNYYRVQKEIMQRQQEIAHIIRGIQDECIKEVLRADSEYEAGQEKGVGGMCYEERWLQLTAPRYQRRAPLEPSPEESHPLPSESSSSELGRLEAEAQFSAMRFLKPELVPRLKKWEQASIERKGTEYQRGFMEQWRELGGQLEP